MTVRPRHRLLFSSALGGLAVILSLAVAPPAASAAEIARTGSGKTFQSIPVPPVTVPAPGVVLTPGINVPDPSIIEVAGVYFMFASQETFYGANVPLMVSTSLTSWGPTTLDAMPQLPSWAGSGFTWSPDVRAIDGHYVMWFSADLLAGGFGQTKCIGVATSSSVIGPYVSSASKPLVCQLNHLGSIDPRTFRDPDGRLWLLWKSDDNADVNGTTHTTIFVQRLTSDGLALKGPRFALLTADLPWEGRIVEAPDMVFAGGRYWLFFSGNWFNQPAYGIGVAQCAGPTGPCQPSSVGPWLASNAQGSGPGEESLFYDGSRWWMLYAPFSPGAEGVTPRPAAMARLVFGREGPEVVAPETVAWDRAGQAVVTVGAMRASARAAPGCAGRRSGSTCSAATAQSFTKFMK